MSQLASILENFEAGPHGAGEDVRSQQLKAAAQSFDAHEKQEKQEQNRNDSQRNVPRGGGGRHVGGPLGLTNHSSWCPLAQPRPAGQRVFVTFR